MDLPDVAECRWLEYHCVVFILYLDRRVYGETDILIGRWVLMDGYSKRQIEGYRSTYSLSINILSISKAVFHIQIRFYLYLKRPTSIPLFPFCLMPTLSRSSHVLVLYHSIPKSPTYSRHTFQCRFPTLPFSQLCPSAYQMGGYLKGQV